MSVRWPRVLTSTHLSQIIKTQKNPLTALQIFKGVKEKYPNYNHNGSVYATMISILGKSNHITEMKEVIDRMKEDSCECKDSIFASAIHTFANNGRLSEAVSLFDKLPQFNCVHWTQSFNTLLREMVKDSKLDDAFRFFLHNSFGWGIKSRLKSLNLLMEVLCGLKRSDLASQVFQEMSYQGCCPDRESYQILMKGLCEDGKSEEATHLLYSMFWRISRKGAGEDVVIYRTLLNSLCDDGKIDEALEILGKILRKGLKAPKRYYNRLNLTQCNSKEQIEGAKYLINEALIRGVTPSLVSYSAMAIDLYTEGRISEAEMVLEEMRGRGFSPTSVLYEAKIAALCRNGKVEEAVNVVNEEMVKGNCLPTVKAYNNLIKGLCEDGNSMLGMEYVKQKMAKQVGCVANEESYSILVNGLCSECRFLEGSQVLEEMLIKSYRPSVETYNRVLTGLCSIGRRYEALMWLEEMISQGILPALSVWTSVVECECSDMSSSDEVFKHLTGTS